MLTYLLAVLAACANATSSVLQRSANREAPERRLGWQLVKGLLQRPVWLAGVGALTAGFLLQAAALSRGALAVVEPILVIELPVSLLLASAVFRGRLRWRDWASIAAITVGLAGLLYSLAPAGEADAHVNGRMWAVAISVNLGLIALLALGAAGGGCTRRAALLGVAAGAGFGLAAALMKAMTYTFAGGVEGVLLAWQTYAMIAAGLLGMFLLQGAFNAGSLVAAQPGVTATDPIVSILWGTVVFGETVRGGLYLLLAAAAVGLIAAGVAELARSPLVTSGPPVPAPPPRPQSVELGC